VALTSLPTPSQAATPPPPSLLLFPRRGVTPSPWTQVLHASRSRLLSQRPTSLHVDISDATSVRPPPPPAAVGFRPGTTAQPHKRRNLSRTPLFAPQNTPYSPRSSKRLRWPSERGPPSGQGSCPALSPPPSTGRVRARLAGPQVSWPALVGARAVLQNRTTKPPPSRARHLSAERRRASPSANGRLERRLTAGSRTTTPQHTPAQARTRQWDSTHATTAPPAKFGFDAFVGDACSLRERTDDKAGKPSGKYEAETKPSIATANDHKTRHHNKTNLLPLLAPDARHVPSSPPATNAHTPRVIQMAPPPRHSADADPNAPRMRGPTRVTAVRARPDHPG